jgi:hypothetical protein
MDGLRTIDGPGTHRDPPDWDRAESAGTIAYHDAKGGAERLEAAAAGSAAVDSDARD